MLKENNLIDSYLNQERVVGVFSDSSAEKIASFYSDFVRGKVCITDVKAAELVNLTEGAYEAIHMAFANELSLICDQQDVAVSELIELINRCKHVPLSEPGVGIGNPLIKRAAQTLQSCTNVDATVIGASLKTDHVKREEIFETVKAFAEEVDLTAIACFGACRLPDSSMLVPLWILFLN